MEKHKKENKRDPAGSTLDQTIVQMLREDPGFREEYIQQTLKDDDPRMLILSLRKVVDAVGGISALSKETKLNRTQLYRTLSEKGKPEFFTLARILNYLGLHFCVERNARRA